MSSDSFKNIVNGLRQVFRKEPSPVISSDQCAAALTEAFDLAQSAGARWITLLTVPGMHRWQLRLGFQNEQEGAYSVTADGPRETGVLAQVQDRLLDWQQRHAEWPAPVFQAIAGQHCDVRSRARWVEACVSDLVRSEITPPASQIKDEQEQGVSRRRRMR
jgi:hypothetical protein